MLCLCLKIQNSLLHAFCNRKGFLKVGVIKNIGLRRINLILALVHFAQGTAVALLSQDLQVPLKTDHLVFDANTSSLVVAQKQLGTFSLPVLIVLFFYLSAAAHLLVATVYYRRYAENLKKGINRARWYEYSLSASVMMVAISMLVGVSDVSIFVTIFALTAFMNMMGLVMEVSNSGTKKVSWLSYKIGSLAGLVPWAIVVYYFYASAQYGGAKPPTFVYWIFVSIFFFFSCFAVNMWLQYKKIGKWKNYLYGERVYMVLSLVAKAALAWQIFAGTLRP